MKKIRKERAKVEAAVAMTALVTLPRSLEFDVGVGNREKGG